MRELREFRETHSEFVNAGTVVAGVSQDDVASHRAWVARLKLPFPLLSDPGREVAKRLGVVHRVKLASWELELHRRSTLLIDAEGLVAAVWGKVQVRGHAAQVLAAARALAAG